MLGQKNVKKIVVFFGVWENLAFCFRDLLTFNITGILGPARIIINQDKIYLLKYLHLVENLFERAFGSENFDFGS